MSGLRTVAIIGGGLWLLSKLGGRRGEGAKPKTTEPTIVTLGDLDLPPRVDPIDPIDPTAPEDPRVVLVRMYDDFLRDEPTPGFLYQIRKGDNLSDLVKRALGRSSGTYARAFAGAAWNASVYGAEPPASQTTGVATVNGRKVAIGAAFTPNNYDPRDSLYLEGTVRRAVKFRRSATGKLRWHALGDDYGVVWVPPLRDDGEPIVWPWDAPEGNPAPLVAAMGLDPTSLTKPWEIDDA